VNRTLLIITGWLLCAAVAPTIAQEQKGVADRLLEDLKVEESDPKTKPSTGWLGVADEMTRIAKQLPKPETSSEALAAQETLIRQLSQLLERSKSESSTAAAANGESQGDAAQRNPSRQNSNRRDDDQGQSATGQGPATKAGAAKSNSDESAGSKESPNVLMRRAWGQLPGRVRERLQSSTPEQFHKKYQAESETYFRKLAEKEHQP
jgi:hypothetical protein